MSIVEHACADTCFVAWVTRIVRAERPHLVAAARAEGLTDAEALDAVQDRLVTFLGLPAASELIDRTVTARGCSPPSCATPRATCAAATTARARTTARSTRSRRATTTRSIGSRAPRIGSR
jgi:hypothetical protein